MLALTAAAHLAQFKNPYGSFHCHNISEPINASKFPGGGELIASNEKEPLLTNKEMYWFCSTTCFWEPHLCVPNCLGPDCQGTTVEHYEFTCGANLDDWPEDSTRDCGSWTSFCECAPCVSKGMKPYPPRLKYFQTPGNVTWQDARSDCQARGGDLASIHSAVENAAVHAATGGKYAYIGLASTGGASWAWSDGSANDYTNWGPLEPSGLEAQSCAAFKPPVDPTPPSPPPSPPWPSTAPLDSSSPPPACDWQKADAILNGGGHEEAESLQQRLIQERNGEAPYQVVKSGDCPSNGLEYITDYCECGVAGDDLGVGGNREYYEETQGFPSGNRQKYCGTWGDMGHLHFNSQTSGDLNGYPILQKAGQDVAGPSPTYQICKKGGTTLPSKCATVQSPYEVVKSGDCPSKGLAYITTYCECGIAGTVLGVGINKEKYEETQGFPSGNRQKYCGTWGGTAHLHFNSQTSGSMGGYPILQKAGHDVAGPSPTYQICKKGGKKGGEKLGQKEDHKGGKKEAKKEGKKEGARAAAQGEHRRAAGHSRHPGRPSARDGRGATPDWMDDFAGQMADEILNDSGGNDDARVLQQRLRRKPTAKPTEKAPSDPAHVPPGTWFATSCEGKDPFDDDAPIGYVCLIPPPPPPPDTTWCNEHYMATVKVGKKPDDGFWDSCCCEGVGGCLEYLSNYSATDVNEVVEQGGDWASPPGNPACLASAPCNISFGPCFADDQCLSGACYSRQNGEDVPDVYIPPSWPDDKNVCYDDGCECPVCPPPFNGYEMCVGHGYDRAQCEGVGCCKFAECPFGDGTGECLSNVGQNQCLLTPFSTYVEDGPSCQPPCHASLADTLVCHDGTELPITTSWSWPSCDAHQGRKLCPRTWPFMCAEMSNTDNMAFPGPWCKQTEADCGSLGGLLSCSDEPPEVVHEASPPPPCGFDKIGLTPNWQFTKSGGGTWTSTLSTIRFDFDNDPKCGGWNSNVQEGTAEWKFDLSAAATVTLSMEGRAESSYETFTLKSDGITVTEVQASNGEGGSTCQVHTCNMCPVSMPSTPLSLTAGEHTLRVDVSTKDGMYQDSAYFQITFSVKNDEGECPPDLPPMHEADPPPPPQKVVVKLYSDGRPYTGMGMEHICSPDPECWQDTSMDWQATKDRCEKGTIAMLGECPEPDACVMPGADPASAKCDLPEDGFTKGQVHCSLGGERLCTLQEICPDGTAGPPIFSEEGALGEDSIWKTDSGPIRDQDWIKWNARTAVQRDDGQHDFVQIGSGAPGRCKSVLDEQGAGEVANKDTRQSAPEKQWYFCCSDQVHTLATPAPAWSDPSTVAPHTPAGGRRARHDDARS